MSIVLGFFVKIIVADVEPAERTDVGGQGKVVDGVLEVRTTAGVVEGLVEHELAGGVGDISTTLDVRVSGETEVPRGDTLVVDVSAVGEGRGRGSLDDVGR